jgi:methyl acetate hydrolase
VPQEGGMTHDRHCPPIDAQLRQAVADKAVLGVVALAADRDGVLYRGAFGLADAVSGRPMTPDALFRIASMTKAITSVAALQLVEAGALGLDDPAERHLPA